MSRYPRFQFTELKVFEKLLNIGKFGTFKDCPNNDHNERKNDAQICLQYSFPPTKTYELINSDDNEYNVVERMEPSAARKAGFSGT